MKAITIFLEVTNNMSESLTKHQDCGQSEPAFLGVEESLEGKRWLIRDADSRQTLALAQRLNVPEILARILAGRGIGLNEASAFLEPKLRELMPNPSSLIDMDKAAERISAAIVQNETIGIFGDYDVDGATSSSLLVRFIRAVGGDSLVYIPNRLEEGYGPNVAGLTTLAKKGASVVITVDCGTSAHGPLAEASKNGLDIIVVDHHAAEPDLPRVLAVVNPNRIDDNSGQGALAAVGVAFLLVIAVNRILRKGGWFDDRTEPDLMQWLDLVALGTVCDVVPLIGLNRAFVHQGLRVMARRTNPGLMSLADVGGITEIPSAYHLGFIMGPRVNAGGRIGSPDLGARILATDDIAEARKIAINLDNLNRERQLIERKVLDQALSQVEQESDGRGATVFTVGKGWHTGVLGIVASRLKERFNRPACVLAIDNTGKVTTGSGRSVKGVDLGAIVIAASQAGVINKGGGHAMAAGFTLRADQIPTFRAFLDERVRARIKETGIRPTLQLDGVLTTRGANLDVAHILQGLSPFGSSNPEPRFALSGARVTFADRVGENHVRATLEGEEGSKLQAICFSCTDRPLGRLLLQANGLPVNIAGRLRVNCWRGRSAPQFMIDDANPIW